MRTKQNLQNRFLAAVVVALTVSVLIVVASLTQAVVYVPAYA